MQYIQQGHLAVWIQSFYVNDIAIASVLNDIICRNGQIAQ